MKLIPCLIRTNELILSPPFIIAIKKIVTAILGECKHINAAILPPFLFHFIKETFFFKIFSECVL